MRSIRAGRLKDCVNIEVCSDDGGEYGGPDPVWSVSAHDVPCDIEPLRASETYKGAGETVQAIYEIRFRYEENLISETNRLVDTTVSPNRIFDIEAVIDPGNWNSEVVVTAREFKWPLRA